MISSRPDRICAHCGASFPVGMGNRKACSRACAVALQRAAGTRFAKEHLKKKHPPKPCLRCGALFGEDLPPSILSDRKYCSKECYGATARPNALECTVCGKWFERARGNRTTCSDTCRRSAHRSAMLARIVKTPAKQCVVCGKEFVRVETGPRRTSAGEFAKRKCCSIQCVGRWVGDQKKLAADEMTKVCRVCGEQFRQRDGEPRYRFLERVTCSKACSKRSLVATHDVGGVLLSIVEIQEMLGVSPTTALRWRRGLGLQKYKPRGQ